MALHTVVADPHCSGCMPDVAHWCRRSLNSEGCGWAATLPSRSRQRPTYGHTAAVHMGLLQPSAKKGSPACFTCEGARSHCASLRHPHIMTFVGSDTRMLQCCGLPVSAMQESKALAAESSWAALQSARQDTILRGIMMTSCWLCRQHLLLWLAATSTPQRTVPHQRQQRQMSLLRRQCQPWTLPQHQMRSCRC